MSEIAEPIELELLRTALAVEIQILSTKEVPTKEDKHVTIKGRFGGEGDCDLEFPDYAAIPLIYFISSLSFSDALPAGYSLNEYKDGDYWAATDMFRLIRYDRGKLLFSSDYEKGRRMKTDITIFPDGTFEIACFDRGDNPLKWIGKLQGDAPTQFAH